jgi:hypothetical protein
LKKIRGNKSAVVIIHIYMEISQETPCVATFISNKQKYHVFLFIFSLFSCTKLENRRIEQVLPGVRVWYQCGGEVAGKAVGG